jgi:hypothetical protein
MLFTAACVSAVRLTMVRCTNSETLTRRDLRPMTELKKMSSVTLWLHTMSRLLLSPRVTRPRRTVLATHTCGKRPAVDMRGFQYAQLSTFVCASSRSSRMPLRSYA